MVDQLVVQFAEFPLFVKKMFEKVGPVATVDDDLVAVSVSKGGSVLLSPLSTPTGTFVSLYVERTLRASLLV